MNDNLLKDVKQYYNIFYGNRYGNEILVSSPTGSADGGSEGARRVPAADIASIVVGCESVCSQLRNQFLAMI